MNIYLGPELVTQLNLSLMCFWLGVKLKLAYDILRLARKVVNAGIIMISLQDLTFFVTAGLLAFNAMYVGNDGIPRAFGLIFILIGAACYNVFPGRFVYQMLENGIKILKKHLGRVLKNLKKRFNIQLKAIFQKDDVNEEK